MHKRDLHQNKDARRFLLILLGLAIVMIGCQLKAYAGDQAEQAEEPLPTARSESNDVLAEGYHHILSLELDRAIACFVKPLIDANRRSLALPANRKHAARCLAFIGRCLAFDNNIASLQALILAHRLDPGNSSILALLARYLDSNGRIEEADAIYKQLQSHANSNFIVAIALGNRALHVCDFQTAERHCRQAVALAPAKSVTHYCLGKALEARGFNKEAAAQHRQAALHEESTYLKEILLGGADELEAKPGSAALHYRAAGDILPDDPLWMSRLAFCQTAQQRRDAPLELLARAARCRRLHVKTLSNYALAQLFSNQAEKALYTINYAAICSPSASQTELVRGHIYLYQSKPEKALAEFKRAIEKNPHTYWAYCGLADALSRQSKPEASIKTMKVCLEKFPAFLYGWEKLGDLYRQEHEWDKALAAYDHPLVSWRDDLKARRAHSARERELASVQAGAGICLAKTGDTAGAIKAAQLFNQYKSAQPSSIALKMIGHRPGRLAFNRNGGRKARACEQAALGDMFYEKGYLAEAKAHHKAAVELDPNNPDWHKYLLHVLLKKKDWLEALREDLIVANDIVKSAPRYVRKAIKKLQSPQDANKADSHPSTQNTTEERAD